MVTDTNSKQASGMPAIYLRLPRHVGEALDYLVSRYSQRRGTTTKNDVVRELILREYRRIRANPNGVEDGI